MRAFKALLGLTGGAALLGLAILLRQYLQPSAYGPGPVLQVAMIVLGLILVAVVSSWLLLGTRLHTLVVRVWLFALAGGISYLTVDVVLGQLRLKNLSPPYVADPYTHHALKPGTVSRVKPWGEEAHRVTVNELGLRGEEVDLERQPETFRIVMLGDSFTMGKGVEDDETFSSVLERRLNATAAGAPRFQVVNAGVESYSPLLSYLQLTTRLEAMDLDLVVFNLDMSDLTQNAVYRDMATYGADGEPVGVDGTKATSRLKEFVYRNLLLTTLLAVNLERLGDADDDSEADVGQAAGQEGMELMAHTLEGAPDFERERRLLWEDILRLRDHCRERGLPFVLTVYPWGHQVDDQEWRPGRDKYLPPDAVVSDTTDDDVETFAQSNGLVFLNAFPAFRAAAGGEPLYLDHDPHWTVAGHRLMARELEGLIRREFLAPPP